MDFYLWEPEGWYSVGVILVEAESEADARTRAWQMVFECYRKQYREWHPSHPAEQMEFYAKHEADLVMDRVLALPPTVMSRPLAFFKREVN